MSTNSLANNQDLKSTGRLNNTGTRTTLNEKSSKFFQTTRVDSCSHVVVRNGVAEAIPFRPAPKKDDGPKQHYTSSLSQYIIKPKHCLTILK